MEYGVDGMDGMDGICGTWMNGDVQRGFGRVNVYMYTVAYRGVAYVNGM